ncbi:uncharacterized protein MICPUCDRAFT_57653 [Micromonas pusilla CCMP1545]|jgi:hypothetical protein|uniref:Vacuolar ATPase assembly protein VMA22 n=1 Tax=Micromonas pusilla (strain CCMP1545) TaxID=564608 RepID=C1MRH4_MICPC|nr:uncharacterized protein MICPUCDRAFT_57653 [Micromonas pusilla CCMP1545]EEH57878.1 predicted protein [Micromonas pusilla CCMP1545]|eukprot:XP_003057927.1 predicted protein [Micromonas pusilla CCMP1545]
MAFLGEINHNAGAMSPRERTEAELLEILELSEELVALKLSLASSMSDANMDVASARIASPFGHHAVGPLAFPTDMEALVGVRVTRREADGDDAGGDDAAAKQASAATREYEVVDRPPRNDEGVAGDDEVKKRKDAAAAGPDGGGLRRRATAAAGAAAGIGAAVAAAAATPPPDALARDGPDPDPDPDPDPRRRRTRPRRPPASWFNGGVPHVGLTRAAGAYAACVETVARAATVSSKIDAALCRFERRGRDSTEGA